MKTHTPVFSAAVILLVLSSPVFAYRQVINLGTLGSYQYSKATSINDNGQIVGYAYADTYDLSGDRRACLFDATGGGANIFLGTLGGLKSSAYSINNNGKIVGQATDSIGAIYACVFDPTGGGSNKNLKYSIASCINNKGYVVGQSGSHAIVSTKPEETWPIGDDLGTLGGSTSLAYSINGSDQIVGYAKNSSGRSRACLFDPPHGTNNIDLGTLGGTDSIAYSINDSGLIVGQASYTTAPPYYYHACLFDATGDGDKIDLGTLGGLKSAALFVNNSDQIVGYASDNSGTFKACLFDATGLGNNINLNDLIDPSSGWILKEADCINNNGWIVGYGTYNGIDQAFLLTPEPATLLLLGLGGLILRGRKSY